MKTNTITRMESKNRPGKGKPTAESEENETVMMCWENLKDSPEKELHVESENKGEKPFKQMQKPENEETTNQTWIQGIHRHLLIQTSWQSGI